MTPSTKKMDKTRETEEIEEIEEKKKKGRKDKYFTEFQQADIAKVLKRFKDVTGSKKDILGWKQAEFLEFLKRHNGAFTDSHTYVRDKFLRKFTNNVRPPVGARLNATPGPLPKNPLQFFPLDEHPPDISKYNMFKKMHKQGVYEDIVAEITKKHSTPDAHQEGASPEGSVLQGSAGSSSGESSGEKKTKPFPVGRLSTKLRERYENLTDDEKAELDEAVTRRNEELREAREATPDSSVWAKNAEHIGALFAEAADSLIGTGPHQVGPYAAFMIQGIVYKGNGVPRTFEYHIGTNPAGKDFLGSEFYKKYKPAKGMKKWSLSTEDWPSADTVDSDDDLKEEPTSKEPIVIDDDKGDGESSDEPIVIDDDQVVPTARRGLKDKDTTEIGDRSTAATRTKAKGKRPIVIDSDSEDEGPIVKNAATNADQHGQKPSHVPRPGPLTASSTSAVSIAKNITTNADQRGRKEAIREEATPLTPPKTTSVTDDPRPTPAIDSSLPPASALAVSPAAAPVDVSTAPSRGSRNSADDHSTASAGSHERQREVPAQEDKDGSAAPGVDVPVDGSQGPPPAKTAPSARGVKTRTQRRKASAAVAVEASTSGPILRKRTRRDGAQDDEAPAQINTRLRSAKKAAVADTNTRPVKKPRRK